MTMDSQGKDGKDVNLDSIEPIYEELALRMKFQNHTYYGPRLLRTLVDLDEAEILRELPAPVEEVAKKLNVDKDKVEQTITKGVKTGVLIKLPDGSVGIRWGLMFLVEMGATNPELGELYTEEFWNLYERMYVDVAWRTKEFKDSKQLIENTGTHFVRVLPRWKAIKDIPGVMPCEDMREVLKAYDGRLSTSICGCRMAMNKRGCNVPDGTIPEEGFCIHFERGADYWVKELGVGRFMSAEEVLESLERLNKSPIYHTVDNHRDSQMICNCCTCCCSLQAAVGRVEGVRPKDLIAPSRFLCITNEERCDGCKICLTKCPFSAITVTKNGKAAVDADKCLGCGSCVINCPNDALKMKIVRPPEHIPEVATMYLVNEFLEDENSRFFQGVD